MFLPSEQLGDLIQNYIREGEALREQITEICYFMKGGIEYGSAWMMSFEDREIAIRVINRRLKDENPNGKEYF